MPFEFRIVTQFALAGDAYVDWERGIRAAGNRLPVIAGIPGVTSPPRLLKFALACGIGPSIEVLRKQSGGLLKLATTRSWKPDEVVSTIAQSVARDPASLITGLHVFPFGGLEASAEWLAERRARARQCLDKRDSLRRKESMDTVLESQSKTVVIGAGRPFCIIGERINPTGRKAFQAQLQSGDLSQIEIDVEEQLAGADMLDVNVGDPLADEVALMDQAVRMIQGMTDIPLCIDSSVIEALEAAWPLTRARRWSTRSRVRTSAWTRSCRWWPSTEPRLLVWPMMTRSPMDPQRRLEIARKIVSRAGDYGIKPEDVVIDPLAMPVGAEPRAVNLFNDTVRLIRDDLGVNMTCGASNTAFGLPDRPTLGATFLAIAESHGLTSAIMDARSQQCIEGFVPPTSCSAMTSGGRAGSPRTERERRLHQRERCRGARGRGHPAGTHQVPARRHRDAGSGGNHDLRRGLLERGCDRLHLRGPRHLQEVQDQDPLRQRPHLQRRSAAFSPDEMRSGWRFACRAAAVVDIEAEVPPLQTRPKAALVGVGRHVILRPAVQKRYVELEEPTLEDQVSDLERLLAAVSDLELKVCWARSPNSRRCFAAANFKVTAVVVDDTLIDVEAGDTTDRRFAIAYDLGTTTVVATLLDLSTGQPLAVRSVLNRQQPYGADVISRVSATMMDADALEHFRPAPRRRSACSRQRFAPRRASIPPRCTRSCCAATRR